MKSTITYLIFLLMPVMAFSQPESACGTADIDTAHFMNEPYWGNNQFLDNLVDSLENTVIPASISDAAATGVSTVNELYHLPVKAWVYTEGDGSGTFPDRGKVEDLINGMNLTLRENGVSIRLYLLCDISYIANTNFYRLIRCKTAEFCAEGKSLEELFSDHFQDGVFNLHFVRNVSEDLDLGGYARRPTHNRPYSFMVATHSRSSTGALNIIGSGNIITTMVHEFGHTLDLNHTHQSAFSAAIGGANSNGPIDNPCLQEYVDRDKVITGGMCWDTPWHLFGRLGKRACEVNGDGLCDTEADPLLDYGWNYNIPGAAPGCVFFPPTPVWIWQLWWLQDLDTEPWTPDLTNLMSYGSFCRSSITRNQRGVMYQHCMERLAAVSYRVARGWLQLPNGYCGNRTIELDDFENDNYWRSQHPVFPDRYTNLVPVYEGGPRNYSFHIGCSGDCDRDWLRFDLPNTSVSTMPVFIKTERVDDGAGDYLPPPTTLHFDLWQFDTASDDIVPVETSPGVQFEVLTTAVDHIETTSSIDLPDDNVYFLRFRPLSPETEHKFYRVELSFNVDATGACFNIGGECVAPDSDLGTFCQGDRFSVGGVESDDVVYTVATSDPRVSFIPISGSPGAFTIGITGGFSGEVEFTVTLTTSTGLPISSYTNTAWFGPPADFNIIGYGPFCAPSSSGTSLGGSTLSGRFIAGIPAGSYSSIEFTVIADGTTGIPAGIVDTQISTDGIYDVDALMLPPGRYTILAIAYNECGPTVAEPSQFDVRDCETTSAGSMVTAFPNPSSGSVTVSLNKAAPLSPSGLIIKIYDRRGFLVKEKQTNTFSVNFDVSDLSPDVYFIHVINGGDYEKINFVKE